MTDPAGELDVQPRDDLDPRIATALHFATQSPYPAHQTPELTADTSTT